MIGLEQFMSTGVPLFEDEWRPVPYQGKVIPTLFVSKDGRGLSTRTKTPRILNPTKGSHASKGKKYQLAPSFGITLDIKDFPQLEKRAKPFQKYVNDPTSKYHKRVRKSPDAIQVTIPKYRAVKEAWEPLDSHSHEMGIPKEDWDAAPETVKQALRELAHIDHKDGDTQNNHLSNLKWATARQNNPWTKAILESERVC